MTDKELWLARVREVEAIYRNDVAVVWPERIVAQPPIPPLPELS